MKITLRIDGKEKEFVTDFISARKFRKALELNEKDKGKEVSLLESLDKLAEYVVTVFDNQFTLDELWEGIPAGKINSELMRIFNEVLGLEGLAVIDGQDEGK
ncbi:hypothetical protein MTP04_24370 [Lysinibacillus sp. PLM2]|nr:hypothetical protein MTP04_24370 [Lysinibacillus sp. PLM2]